MKETIEIENPHTGRPVTVEIEDEDWLPVNDMIDIAGKEFIICVAYVLTFIRDKETGETRLVYYEETKSD